MVNSFSHPVLYLCVDQSNPDLVNKYQNVVEEHNFSVNNDLYPNSGFDLYFTQDVQFHDIKSKLVDFRVKCEMRYIDTIQNISTHTGLYLYPRSSMSKTPLMLANHTGIIDSGYRGYIMGAFRHLGNVNEPWLVKQDERLVQICSPNLQPFTVHLVDESFFQETTRGNGGFGSTG
jgi:dUTP pyrophosphatase